MAGRAGAGGTGAGAALPGLPGTYAVLLEPLHPGRLRIGRLGALDLSADCLVYVGSALGPGGVGARCAHHLRLARRPHWHLDWLRPACRVCALWYGLGPQRGEHLWAAALAALPGARLALPGFGASDCRCPAHLYAFPARPAATLPSTDCPVTLPKLATPGAFLGRRGGLRVGRRTRVTR